MKRARQFLVAATIGAAKGAGRLAGYGGIVDAVESGQAIWDEVGQEQTTAAIADPAAEVTLLAELRDTFAAAVKTTGKRFVIFVDDLDRLEPARAVEVMEAIKVLFDVENCVFVLAIDFDIVKRGVQVKYGEGFTAERAQAFFDKIIQIPFNLPTGSYRTSAYLEELTGATGSPDAVLRTNLALSSVGRNPRSIKRLFNTLQLLSLVRARMSSAAPGKNEEFGVRQETQLFAMLCMQTRYASVYEAFMRAASSPSEDAAEKLRNLFQQTLPEETEEPTEHSDAPAAGSRERTPFPQFPGVKGADLEALESFLGHLRTAFAGMGGKLDTYALLSAVTNSAVTARGESPRASGDVRTNTDSQARFTALEESTKVRPEVIELLHDLDKKAKVHDVYSGMQGKVTDWTGYATGIRSGNGSKDERLYRLFRAECGRAGGAG